MDLATIFDLTWIPLLAFALCFLAGSHMFYLGKRPPYLMTKGDYRPLRDEANYAKKGGLLLIFLSMGALLMTVLLFVHIVLAVLVMTAWYLVFSVLWKKMSSRYGAI